MNVFFNTFQKIPKVFTVFLSPKYQGDNISMIIKCKTLNIKMSSKYESEESHPQNSLNNTKLFPQLF